MARQVHNTDMVAHLWAHQSQESARNGQGNFYFRGSTIYSYGSHFPIARHVDEKTILFTTRDYSPTTAGHKTCVRSAIPDGKTVIYCHNACASTAPEHAENLQFMIDDIGLFKKRFDQSRIDKKIVLQRWKNSIAYTNAYAKRFKLSQRVKPLRVTKEMLKAVRLSEAKRRKHVADVEARRAARYERIRKENAEYERQRLAADEEWKRNREALWAAWLRGEGSTHSLKDRHEKPVMLRVRKAISETHGGLDPVVETTLGAIVPLEDVRKAFVIWSLCVRKAQAWKRNGEQIKVGDFQLDSISETGDVVAGCHRIHAHEIKRFAVIQNWMSISESGL